MDKVYYHEKQKYGSGFILLAAIPLLASVFIWYMDMRDPSMTFAGLMISVGVNILLSIGLFFLFYKMTLEIKIKNNCLEMRYPPFRRKPLCYSKSDIVKWEVREFKPLKEFGGLGYKKHKAMNKPSIISYTIKGKSGLEIALQNGSKLLFGTQRKQALNHAMRKWMEGV